MRLPPLQAQTLGIDELREVARIVFVSRNATVHEVALRFDLERLCAATEAVLDLLVGTVSALDDGAYEPQADDFDGSDVWSAGEILGHIIEMEFASRQFWESTSCLELAVPADDLVRALTQPPATAMAGLDVATQFRSASLESLDRIASRCDGRERAVHFMLGPSSVNAALLGNCLHVLDHVDQLKAFSAVS